MFRSIIALATALVLISWQAWPPAVMGMQEVISPENNRDARSGRLQVQLQRHRDMAAAGGWPVVPEGPTIRPGANDPRLAILARRLTVTGDFSEMEISVPTSNYNEALQEAVRRFQARHGLETDALVGARTLRVLNVPVEQRIDQIRLNLERIHHVLDDRRNDHVLVNIPGFKAHIVQDRKTVWSTKVIVGETEDQTPEFNASLKYVVFNPTWTVPRSIAIEEMLPKIKLDPGYLDKGKYHLFDSESNEIAPSDVDWSALTEDNFPYTLVQRPGPWNELGQIKFMFPNEYSVCMHDTPRKALFAQAERTLSHGCVRVDEPLEFAEVLLRSEGWSREQIDDRIDSAETSTVVLSAPFPILLVYWTAEVDELGIMHFYEDIYDRDAAELKALAR